MRISDWSSDVCSSDLWPSCLRHRNGVSPPSRARVKNIVTRLGKCSSVRIVSPGSADAAFDQEPSALRRTGKTLCRAGSHCICNAREAVRSEEHTSELQSLMRISYAVFCLKKKI